MYSTETLVTEKTIRPNKVFNNIAISFSRYVLVETLTEGGVPDHGLEKYNQNLDDVPVNRGFDKFTISYSANHNLQ